MQVELVAVVGPRAELQVARLLVEREVTNVDGARALEDRHRDPQDVADGRDDGHRLAVLLEARVCTGGGRERDVNTGHGTRNDMADVLHIDASSKRQILI